MKLVVLSLFAAAIVLSAATVAATEEPGDLQALIDAAAPGDTIELTARTYAGGVTIDKPLTLVGVDWPTVDAGGTETVIMVNAADVTIEGLVIRGTGNSLDRENSGVSSDGSPRLTVEGNRFEDVLFGVFLRTSPNSTVAHNEIGAKELTLGRRGDGIRLWECPESLVEGNTIDGGRDTVMWFSEGVVVRDNVVSNGRYGLHFMYSDGAVVENNQLIGNSVGAFMMYGRDITLRDNVMAENYGPSGYGIGLKDMDRVTAVGNRLIGNRIGLYLDNSPWSYEEHQTFSGNLFAYNDVGVMFLPNVKRNSFTNNAFIDNGEQVGIQGTGTFSGNEWTVGGVGNYWSDFAGFDADRDGIGDVPYRLDDLYSTLTDQHPELQFFRETPAARAVDLSAQMFPVLRPRPKVEDIAPLVDQPVLRPVTAAAQQRGVGLLAISLLLAATSGGIVWSSWRPNRSKGLPA